MSEQSDSGFDHIIVGAGAAGSVLAARLSEDPARRVLLVEAGKDVPPGREPHDVRNVFPLSTYNDRIQWPEMLVHFRRSFNSPAVRFPQGRILGGTSAIMGMWAMRGQPEDYDGWAQQGATGWSWNDVLPYFIKLESDQDYDGPLHGSSGPIPFRRLPRSEWSPIAKAVHRAVSARGWETIEDASADFRSGETVLATSRFVHTRASAGICYLTAETRARKNLSVVTDVEITRVLFESRRAVGILGRHRDGSLFETRGAETILTAGALQTPALLLRSGVGAAEALRAVGLQTLVDSPGVGRNLQNHTLLPILAILKPQGLGPGGWRPAGANYLRWSSGRPGTPPNDLGMYVRDHLTWHALGRRLATLSPTLTRPDSSGQVQLTSPDPTQRPLIEFNFLESQNDLARMMDGVRFAVDLFESPEISEVCHAPRAMTNPAGLARYNRLSHINAVRGWLAGFALDVAPKLGEAALLKVGKMRSARSLVQDEKELEAFVQRAIMGVGHVCGTCRMGHSDDRQAVTDSFGRVRGALGLRVADASIMPFVPSVNTHIPVVMCSEKIAESIRSGREPAQ